MIGSNPWNGSNGLFGVSFVFLEDKLILQSLSDCWLFWEGTVAAVSVAVSCCFSGQEVAHVIAEGSDISLVRGIC